MKKLKAFNPDGNEIPWKPITEISDEQLKAEYVLLLVAGDPRLAYWNDFISSWQECYTREWLFSVTHFATIIN
jgi:hypothetical protein